MQNKQGLILFTIDVCRGIQRELTVLNYKYLKIIFYCFVFAVCFCVRSGYALLPVQNFNALYRAASSRQLDIISHAIARGMNIDSPNRNGDTGLCVAIRNNDITAYNVFRHFGANPNHSCILNIPQSQYRYFMAVNPDREIEYTSASARYAQRQVQNSNKQNYNNLYSNSWLKSPVTWTIGGLALAAGGIALAKSGSGGSKKKHYPTVTPGGGGGDSDFDFSTLHGVSGAPIYNKTNISKNIQDSPTAEQSSLWAVYATENKNIANTADITLTANDTSYNHEHWGAIYTKNGYTYNAGVISITSENKYAAGLMACVVDSYTINTACFTNDNNSISGDVYNNGTIDITANQSKGIFTGETQNITNAGKIKLTGNDNSGIFVYGSANKIQNDGTIELSGKGSDYYAGSMSGIWVSETADITNKGSISIKSDDYTANGIYSKDGTTINSGTVKIDGGGTGLKSNQGTLINQNTIEITNSGDNKTYGMKVDSNGTATNTGNIKITGSGYGMYVTSGTALNDTSGSITIANNPGINTLGYAMAGNGTVTNKGKITSASGGLTGDNLFNEGTIESDKIALNTEGNAQNSGNIASQSYGFYATQNGTLSNTGTISAVSGIRADLGSITNSGSISSENKGVDVVNSTITNTGTIKSQNNVAIETSQSTIENTADATISTDSSLGILAHTICMKGNKRCEDAEDDEGNPNYYSPKLTVNNDGLISLTNGGTAIKISGDEEHAKNPTLNLTNTGTIEIKNKTSTNEIIGINGIGYDEVNDISEEENKPQIESTSTITNSGYITLDNRGSGINNDMSGIVINKGTITNSGTLRMYNDSFEESDNKNVVGIKINEGTATNTGKIIISSNNAIGMLAEYTGDDSKLKNDEIKAQVINKGEITLIGKNNIALYAKNKGSAVTNEGTVIVRESNLTETFRKYTDTVYTETNSCNEFICLEEGGVYKNAGNLLSTQKLTFSKTSGRTLLSTGSRVVAPSISGTVYADYDLVTDNFENTITTEEDSLVGDTSDLEVKSLSVLYTAQLVPTNVSPQTVSTNLSLSSVSAAMALASLSNSLPSHNITLNRKNFNEFTTNTSAAQYLERNYALGNNQALYNELKSTSSSDNVSQKIDYALGLKMFPDFSKQTLDSIRILNTEISDSILGNKDEKEVRAIVGINTHYRKQDKTLDHYGFTDKIQSVFGLVDKKTGEHTRIGLGLNYARSDAKYDKNNKRRNNLIQIFAPFVYHNALYQFMSTPRLGVLWGKYDRHGNESTYHGKTHEAYYGITNELRRDIAFEKFILEPNAEFNIAGLYTSKIKEDSGLNIDSHNDVSAEIGLGLYLKKTFEFSNQGNLTVRAGGSTYLEMLNPYHRLHGAMPQMAGSYKLNKTSASKTRSVLKTSVKYQKEQMNLIGELNKYIEDSDGYEVDLRMQYDL